MTKIRVTLTLDPTTVEILDETGNKSGYVNTLIQRQRERITDALRELRRAGVNNDDLALACSSTVFYQNLMMRMGGLEYAVLLVVEEARTLQNEWLREMLGF